MKIIEINELSKKDSPLHYRKEFTGHVIWEITGHKELKTPLEFRLEHSPLGAPSVQITLLEDIHYPILSFKKTLKDLIIRMEREGRLN